MQQIGYGTHWSMDSEVPDIDNSFANLSHELFYLLNEMREDTDTFQADLLLAGSPTAAANFIDGRQWKWSESLSQAAREYLIDKGPCAGSPNYLTTAYAKYIKSWCGS